MARRVFVTGANRGLGNLLVRTLVERGDEVWGSAREADPRRLLALEPAGVVQMELGDEESIIAGAEALDARLDGLDVLINCAGVDARAFGANPDERGPFDLDAATVESVVRINVSAPMILMRELRPLLAAGIDPVVLNISSQLGSMDVAAELGNDTAYCISKAAFNMLSVKTAAALKPEGIAVVAMHPGWVATDMGGPSATLSPEESAASIVGTLDELSLSDTGTFMNWDGSPHPW